MKEMKIIESHIAGFTGAETGPEKSVKRTSRPIYVVH